MRARVFTQEPAALYTAPESVGERRTVDVQIDDAVLLSADLGQNLPMRVEVVGCFRGPAVGCWAKAYAGTSK
jgi:hypothetical protein